MSDERNAWDQMVDEGENDLWYGRFRQFMLLRPTKRSIRAVFLKQSQVKPSTNVGPEWCDAAKRWKWVERARAKDEHDRSEEDQVITEERNKVTRSRYALMHKRIRLLERLLGKLVGYTNDESKIWLAETKTTTSTYGEDRSTEIVIEKTTFNAPLFMLIDKYLNSIAVEMGERVKKKDLGVVSGETEFEIELIGKSPDEDEE